MTTTLTIIDPELGLDALADLAGRGDAVATFFNPLHREALPEADLLRAPRGYQELRAGFDQIHWALLAARAADVAKTPIDGIDTHMIDLAGILEVGFATEIHILLASHFENVTVDRVEIRAGRDVFARIALAYASRRGWDADLRMVGDQSTAKASARRQFERVAAVSRQLLAWQKPGRKKLYSADHRQTRPLLDALRADGRFAVATPRFASAVALATGRITRPTPSQVSQARDAMRRLREFGREHVTGYVVDAWETLFDVFETQLPGVLNELSRVLGSLDVVRPDMMLAPAWTGIEAHAMRAWTRTYGVPFAAIQHGYKIGNHLCSRTSALDTDILYNWSDRFVNEWIDKSRSPGSIHVPIGNPAYQGIRAKAPRTPKSVMFAPSGALEFGRESLFDFWNAAFEITQKRPDIEWKIRPHVQSRNNDWIRSRSDELGLIWSRDQEPDVFAALEDTDIVVTTVSTMALDAVMRGVLCVLVNDLEEHPLFLRDQIAAYTESTAEIGDVVTRLYDDAAERERAYARQAPVVAEYSGDDIIPRFVDDLAGR